MKRYQNGSLVGSFFHRFYDACSCLLGSGLWLVNQVSLLVFDTPPQGAPVIFTMVAHLTDPEKELIDTIARRKTGTADPALDAVNGFQLKPQWQVHRNDDHLD